jgi:hypothetical protein
MLKHFLAGISALALAAAIGCSDEDSPSVIEEVFSESCSDICERYNECVADIHVGNCVDECEAADDNEITEARIEACDDCVDDGTCQDIEACWQACPVFPSMR